MCHSLDYMKYLIKKRTHSMKHTHSVCVRLALVGLFWCSVVGLFWHLVGHSMCVCPFDHD